MLRYGVRGERWGRKGGEMGGGKGVGCGEQIGVRACMCVWCVD